MLGIDHSKGHGNKGDRQKHKEADHKTNKTVHASNHSLQHEKTYFQIIILFQKISKHTDRNNLQFLFM